MLSWRMCCERQRGDDKLESVSKGLFYCDLWLTFNGFLIRVFNGMIRLYFRMEKERLMGEHLGGYLNSLSYFND